MKKLEDTSESSSDIANTWNTAHETLLASIGDKANCMRWMHTQSQVYFERWNFWMAVPSVTVSALAGSATIGITRLDTSSQGIASIVIGVFTIASGVLTSINQLLKASQFSEAHRISSIAYGKLHRVIANELALRRDQRTSAQEFLKIIRTEQDRLEESSPVVGDNIIAKFNNKVETNTTLEKPEIVVQHEKPNLGRVVAVGPGKRDKRGRLRPLDVPVGALVRFGTDEGYLSYPEHREGGRTFLVLQEADVAFIAEPEAPGAALEARGG